MKSLTLNFFFGRIKIVLKYCMSASVLIKDVWKGTCLWYKLKQRKDAACLSLFINLSVIDFFYPFFLIFPFQQAFKYLSWALYPLLGCYAVYSLVYQEHRGWYSWVLSMLYGFLLTFGKYVNSAINLLCNPWTWFELLFID